MSLINSMPLIAERGTKQNEIQRVIKNEIMPKMQ